VLTHLSRALDPGHLGRARLGRSPQRAVTHIGAQRPEGDSVGSGSGSESEMMLGRPADTQTPPHTHTHTHTHTNTHTHTRTQTGDPRFL